MVKAPQEIQQTVQVFRGKDDPLSNMFVCPEACEWGDDGTVYNSSEQEFQHEKVVGHDKPEEACELLEMSNTFQIKAKAHELVPEALIAWVDRGVLYQACYNKFAACSHAREALLNSRSELVEGMHDLKWGSGMDPQCTLDCLPDYWPGQNKMGKILKEIQSKLLEARWLQDLHPEERGEKRNTISPTHENLSKQVLTDGPS